MSRRILPGTSREPADHPPTRFRTCMGTLHVSDRTLGRGPHIRIDGCAAYNGYLWPMPADDFWANQHLNWRHSARWHFFAVALLGGGWLAEGTVLARTETGFGPAHVYPTREAALRVAGARLIRTLRHARSWGRQFDQVSPDDFRALVTWVFDIVGRPAPPIYVPPPPPPPPEPPPAWSDLPLFHGESA